MAKLAFLILWLGLSTAAEAQAVLTPPFGLKWGDTPESLITWADRHSLDIHITLPGTEPGLRVIRIEAEKGPLPGSSARAVEARFQSGRLFEVTVHYGGAADGPDAVEGRFNEVRRQLTAEHGKLLPNKTERLVDDNFATRTLSFHRQPVQGLSLLLAFTEVEDLLRRTREATFSIVYQNLNFRRQLGGGDPAPGPTGAK